MQPSCVAPPAPLLDSLKLYRAWAFVRHDNAEMKWVTIQDWRKKFKERNGGREPTLWIDKFCLDQENISKSLVCLPVFLAGCKTLLVVPGPTYTQRLWCISMVKMAVLAAPQLATRGS